jgi:hypothetical protein
MIVPPADNTHAYVLPTTFGVVYVTVLLFTLSQAGSWLGVITGVGNGFTTTVNTVGAAAVHPFPLV